MSKLYIEKELTQPIKLCDPKGNLNPEAIGWSRFPIHECNLKGHPLRKKRWNYWCITSPTHLFSVTLSNIDYMGLPFIYLLEYESGRFVEKTLMNLFGAGCHLGDFVNNDAFYESKNMKISLAHHNKNVQLLVETSDFGGKHLSADFLITCPEKHETLNVVVPWSDRLFQFTSKQNTLPVNGTLRWGQEEIKFEGDDTFACLDFGRGVWPYTCFWNWSSFSTRLEDGRSVGINLGAGWTDGTGMNENGLCIDGKLIKLSEDVSFEYSTKNFMAPWHLRTMATDRVNLTFTPFYERVAATNALVVKSKVHQMIGRFDGKLKTENGEEIIIKDAIGWAEDHHAKW